MAKKKLIKSKSNFTIKRLHQNGSYGNIYERDYTTITPSLSIPIGQIPVYNSPSFKLSVRGGNNIQKKYSYGKWVTNPESCSTLNVWTLNCMPIPNNESNKIKIKPNKTQLTDYVCYGSAFELIRASLSDIINKFPAEILISSETLKDIYLFDVEDIDVNSELYRNKFVYENFYIVKNPLYIDILQSVMPDNSNISSLRYFCESQYYYNVIDKNDIIVVDGTELKKWNDENPDKSPKLLWEVFYSEDKECLVNGDLLGVVSILNFEGRTIFQIYCFFYNNDILYLCDKKNGFRLRPNKNIINKFFNELDDFEKVLLNQYTKYTAIFETYIEDDDKGWYLTEKKYQWPIDEGNWNLKITGAIYSKYIQDLSKLALGYDTLFTNAIWNNMTHESITNMDLTKRIVTDDETYDSTKLNKVLNIVGRQFDEIKKYADNIKNSNTITYDQNNNVPDYFISDNLELSGWETKEILNEISDNIVTEPMYDARIIGFKSYDANNEFMRRLKLNSKQIFSSKGTKRCIENLLAIFGFHSMDWLKKYYDNLNSNKLRKAYIIQEHVYVANDYKTGVNPETVANDVKRINQLKDNYSNDDINNLYNNTNEYQGLPLAEVIIHNKTRLVPWFNANIDYDNNMYFQMKGGWARNDGDNLEDSKYDYTISKINYLNNITDLYSLNYGLLHEGDIYYVNDEKNYYKLINIDNYDNIEGWNTLNDEEIMEIESVIENNKGNNPHYGNYDGGISYFDLYREFFKSSQFNNVDDDLKDKNKYGFNIKRQLDNIKTLFYGENFSYENFNGLRGEITLNPYNFFGKVGFNEESSLSVINSKEFHIIFDNHFRDFIEKDILHYLKQIIPSTTIFSYSFEDIENYNGNYYAKINNIICNSDICPITGLVE